MIDLGASRYERMLSEHGTFQPVTTDKFGVFELRLDLLEAVGRSAWLEANPNEVSSTTSPKAVRRGEV